MNELESEAYDFTALPEPVGHALCTLDAIVDGGAIAVDIASSTGGFSIILARTGNQVRAFHNECPHAGRRLDWSPGRFLIDKGLLVCAAHGAAFKLDSGMCNSGPCRGQGLMSFPIMVRDGKIYSGR